MGRERRAKLIAVGVELRNDVRSVLENDQVRAVATFEERNEGGVLLKQREAVQPEIDVLAGLDWPDDVGTSGGLIGCRTGTAVRHCASAPSTN